MLYASPWSPPAFMKTNKDMLQGGSLLPEYYDAWATYYTKFIKAYEADGMPIWGITIQNEPMATQRWESMIYTAEEERQQVEFQWDDYHQQQIDQANQEDWDDDDDDWDDEDEDEK